MQQYIPKPIRQFRGVTTRTAGEPQEVIIAVIYTSWSESPPLRFESFRVFAQKYISPSGHLRPIETIEYS